MFIQGTAGLTLRLRKLINTIPIPSKIGHIIFISKNKYNAILEYAVLIYVFNSMSLKELTPLLRYQLSLSMQLFIHLLSVRRDGFNFSNYHFLEGFLSFESDVRTTWTLRQPQIQKSQGVKIIWRTRWPPNITTLGNDIFMEHPLHRCKRLTMFGCRFRQSV